MQNARLLAGVYATRTDFGVDDAIAAIVNDICGAAVASAVVAIAGKPAVMMMTMMMMAKAMTTMSTEVMSTVMMSTAVKATATATMTTSGRGSGESCGRSERDDDESKFTKHFNLHVWCVAPFQWCEVMPRAREAMCERSHRFLDAAKGD